MKRKFSASPFSHFAEQRRCCTPRPCQYHPAVGIRSFLSTRRNLRLLWIWMGVPNVVIIVSPSFRRRCSNRPETNVADNFYARLQEVGLLLKQAGRCSRSGAGGS